MVQFVTFNVASTEKSPEILLGVNKKLLFFVPLLEYPPIVESFDIITLLLEFFNAENLTVET